MSWQSAYLIRGVLGYLVRLGGVALGLSIFALITGQPGDGPWVWIGAAGLLVGLLAIWLIGYVPASGTDER